MPRRPKLDEGQTLTEVPATNGLTDQEIAELIEASEAEQAQIDELMSEATEACQVHRDEMKAIAKRAAESGLQKRAFACMLKKRKAQRRADTAASSLNDKAREDFERIAAALARLANELGPLGQAAQAHHQASAS